MVISILIAWLFYSLVNQDSKVIRFEKKYIFKTALKISVRFKKKEFRSNAYKKIMFC